jgi:hypothetical protein
LLADAESVPGYDATVTSDEDEVGALIDDFDAHEYLAE